MIRICILIFAAGAMFAQNSYKPEDVAAGGQLFRANCAACHGPNGDGVPGIDLGRGQFRRASSDDDIVRILRNGIAGTAMPPANIPEFQARYIVAYLRSQAEEFTHNVSSGGDASHGEAIFDGKGGCLQCHRVRGKGSRAGPDLSEIGAYRRSSELERSILDPDAEILPSNRTVRTMTSDGAIIEGRLLNQDTFSIQLITSDEKLINLSKPNLREWKVLTQSPMPSYRDKLSSQELADLTNYLVSLKGRRNKQ
jgi:putative heme-binding domain-containing protein